MDSSAFAARAINSNIFWMFPNIDTSLRVIAQVLGNPDSNSFSVGVPLAANLMQANVNPLLHHEYECGQGVKQSLNHM